MSKEFQGRCVVLALACAALVLVTASPVAAQALNLRFLDIGSDSLKQIFDHKIWGYALAAVILFEMLMFGVSRKVAHLIGIFIPAICLAAWLDRVGFIGGISGFTW